MDRTGKTYKHKVSSSIILVVKSKSMSAGTTRHTVLVLDEASNPNHPSGQQVEVDEVPVSPWLRNWDPT